MAAISVVGLGKLGASMAAVLASAGHRVVGVDINARTVQLFNEGRAPVAEPGLDTLMESVAGRLTATSDIRHAVDETDITFVVVATPSESNGEFSLQYVLPAMREIGEAMAAKAEYHLVVLTSTVMPGTTGGPVRSTLEAASGKRVGAEFGLCYGPEFIALGSVIHDLRHPDFLLIGESDRRAGDALLSVYEPVCEDQPVAARMNFTNAEIAKLAINTFVTTKISYANMLAQVCDRVQGADIDVVTKALGLDTRIGSKYLKGGACYGGPCFPRDNRAFAALADLVGANAGLARATELQNEAQVAWVVADVRRRLPVGGRVAVLGLAYKPGTNIAEESHGLKVMQALAGAGFEVVGHDPAATDHARALLADDAERVTLTSEFDDDIWGAHLAIVATPWAEYGSLLSRLLARPDGPTVIDCWRLLSTDRGDSSYVRLGVGPVEGLRAPDDVTNDLSALSQLGRLGLARARREDESGDRSDGCRRCHGSVT
jgi:UDPglucose 6-dehydrogenase